MQTSRSSASIVEQLNAERKKYANCVIAAKITVAILNEGEVNQYDFSRIARASARVARTRREALKHEGRKKKTKIVFLDVCAIAACTPII